MKNKYNLKNIIDRFLHGAINKRLVLLLFLGLFYSASIHAQNCQLDSIVIHDVTCNGGSDGQINFYYTGVPYFFSDDNGVTWNAIDSMINLSAGTLTVLITDDPVTPTCTSDTILVIDQPNPLTAIATLAANVKCFGDSTGESIVNVAGGVGPYTYLWDNGETTQAVSNLWAGLHVVTVTDANLCATQADVTIQHDYDSIQASILEIMTDSLYAPYSISCFGACDAQVRFLAIGGAGPYSYEWDTGPVYYGTGIDTISGLCYGNHSVMVEDDLGCRKQFTFEITQPDELFASAIMHQPVRCYGQDNGMALANGAQGTPPYIFTWDSIGPAGIDTISNQISGNLIDSLTPGIHTVTVTDANGCVASDTVMITEPPLLEVDIIDSLVVYPYCENTNSGELCAVASGGIPNYTYFWFGVGLPQTTPCAYNLDEDVVYTITVTDERNCIAEASFDLDSVTESMNPDLVVITEDPVSCYGGYDGQLTVTNLVGGVSPYTYNWSGPASYSGTGSSISSLQYGNYNVFITDDNGCNINVSAYLNQPDELIYSIYNTVDETCAGAENGQIWVHVDGGTGPYYYDSSEDGWDPDLDTTALIQLVNDSLIFNVVPGGLDTLYVTDENGCEGAVAFGTGTGGFATAAITSLVTVPVPQVNISHTSCFNTNDGFAFAVDPDPLFTYTWETEDLPLNAGEPNGIDVSNGAGTSWGAFAPGTYFLVANYADSASFGIPYSGCDNYAIFTINAGSTPINDGENITDVSCFGDADGQIELIISGGDGPYEVVWDTSSFNPSSHIITGITDTLIDSLLIAGTYSATIIDANGCLTIESYVVGQPLPLISDIVPDHVSCFDGDNGTAKVEVTSGTGTSPFTYTWIDDQGDTLIPPNSPDFAEDLIAGTYIVTVEDAQLCSYTDTIVILQPPSPVTVVEVEDLYYGDNDVRCNGESSAAAFAVGSGVNFEWFEDDGSTLPNNIYLGPAVLDSDGNEVTGQYTDQVLSAGSYIVEAEDINGCKAYALFNITEPDELVLNLLSPTLPSGYEISCYGAKDGVAELDIQGGIEYNSGYGYNITWKDSLGNQWDGNVRAEGLDADLYYTATVIDANGCIDSITTIVYTQPIEFEAKVYTLNYAGPFHGPSKISFVDSTKSDEPYSFHWDWDYDEYGYEDSLYGVEEGDFEIFIHEFEDLDTNRVFVMLTNEATGCQSSKEFAILVQGMPEVNNVFTPNDDNVNDTFTFSEYSMESVDVEIFNRWGQLVYAWSGPNKAWTGIGIDGQPVSQGVYYYVFTAQGVDGHYYEKKGSVTLLR